VSQAGDRAGVRPGPRTRPGLTLHYLWPRHPIVEWLVDRVITLLGRHRAPIIHSYYLQAGEQAFVILGLMPNRKGQLLNDTFDRLFDRDRQCTCLASSGL
jgi:hypothetical protein